MANQLQIKLVRFNSVKNIYNFLREFREHFFLKEFSGSPKELKIATKLIILIF